MKKLYAPWRHNYVTKQHKSPLFDGPLKNDCVFCHKFEVNEDEKFLVVKRFPRCAVIMNYYPYTSGHLMILPFEHKPSLQGLDQATRAEIMEATNHAIIITEKIMQCRGHNVGLNLGVAGGGGIPSHLHVHVVPRWAGDTNFLATTGEISLISSDFYKIYPLLQEAFSTITL